MSALRTVAEILAIPVLATLAFMAALRLPRRRSRWEPRRLHEAQNRPSLGELSDLLDAIDRGDIHEGHYPEGSE